MDIFQIVRHEPPEKISSIIGSITINQLNNHGQNLLHEAIAYQKPVIAHLLISNSIDIDQQDENGQTPLHYAAVYNDAKTAELILQNGGEVNIADKHGNQPLWTAVFNARKHYDLVNLLLEYGADPHHKNKYDMSPLDFAYRINDEELVKLLQTKE